jgi:hypothetical protein
MAKAFAWSFSKLKNYETCPRRHEQIDILKNYREAEEPGGPLDWGNRVHHALHATLGKGEPLPPEMVSYQKYVDMVHKLPGKLYVEQKYAITVGFEPTQYFAPNVWYRGIGDAVKISGTRGTILDWKTGAVKVDSVQLMLMAQCLFSHFPKIMRVHTGYIWLKDDATTVEIYDRKDMADSWLGLLDRVAQLEHASVTKNYPPKPSGLCTRHCPVESCKYYRLGYANRRIENA